MSNSSQLSTDWFRNKDQDSWSKTCRIIYFDYQGVKKATVQCAKMTKYINLLLSYDIVCSGY